MPSILKEKTTIFMRNLSYICFKKLANESTIQKFKVNQPKIIFIYNSKIYGKNLENMLKEVGKLGRLVEKMTTQKEFKSENADMLLNKKYFIGLYDTYKNSRNGLRLMDHVDRLPCLRIYREEDGKKGFFKQRCGMGKISKMINFLIDHSYEDFLIESYDI
jgi:hypothetical protein